MAKAVTDIRSLARTHSRLAISTLAAVARSKSAPAAARVGASVALLERGWGKPQQDLNADVALTVTIRKLIDDDGGAALIDVTPRNLEIDQLGIETDARDGEE